MKTTTKISYKEAVELCDGAQNNKNVEGWKTIKIGGYKQEHGLNVKIYKKDNKVVMAMSGTNLISPLDDKNSLEIIKTTKIPRQFYSAEKMYQTIKKVYPDADIEFVGYSLGGSLANLMSHYTGKPSTAIAPIGSKHIAKANPEIFKYDDSKIDTYGFKNDSFYHFGNGKQSGKIHNLPIYNLNPLSTHLLGNYQKQVDVGLSRDIDNIKYRHNGQIKNFQTYTGFAAPINDGNTFFATEDIAKMSTDEFLAVEDIINNQIKNKIAVPKSEANQKVAQGAYIYISGYTRDDGTKVSGYYRRR